MNNNYQTMQNFIKMIKEFAISNLAKEITPSFIYSNLIMFNIRQDQKPQQDIEDKFIKWQERYEKSNNISTLQSDRMPEFLIFLNGAMRGNEIKLYIPMDYDHISIGANMLFDFLEKENIEHQSKIAKKIRNDNVVVRVNTLLDANKIIEFINKNEYIKQGMLNVNPFLPNCGGIGVTMDNNYSFNFELCNIMSSYVEQLKHNNRLDLLNIDGFNEYIKQIKESTNDLDLKDIYSLLEKTTSIEFELQDFSIHANNKLIDDYKKRKRITDKEYYLQKAIKETEKKIPNQSFGAIKHYLLNETKYITNNNKARLGLIKYVKPHEIEKIVISKLMQFEIELDKLTFDQMLSKYVNITLNRKIDIPNKLK